jgi:ATP-dependent Clp protease ATP-binding subunit ClpA
MFERFTDRARRSTVLAQEEARLLNHNYIGTEHILLGLIHEGEGVAARTLQALGISLAGVREEVEGIVGHGEEETEGHIPYTPRAKKVLELSLREALQLGHNYIGTEHILLGLIREGEGIGSQVLTRLGAELTLVRKTVIELLGPPVGAHAQAVDLGPKINFEFEPAHFKDTHTTVSMARVIEPMDLLRHIKDFRVASAMECLWRVGYGTTEDERQDIKKAIVCLNDYLEHEV